MPRALASRSLVVAPHSPAEAAGVTSPAVLGWAPLGRGFFGGDAREVARALLGKLLVRADGRAARLVEVEAYLGTDDPGSHAFRGPTPRAAIMFGPAAHLYVYFSYGMHWCANVVCGPEGKASAVLLRAAEPVAGLDLMRLARFKGQKVFSDRDLCRGPGRLTNAFGIAGEHNGLDIAPWDRASLLSEPLFWFADDGTGLAGEVLATPRVGLSSSRGADLPWRFVVAGSRWASR
jgi:DNA-3-methyladenine glycosylase